MDIISLVPNNFFTNKKKYRPPFIEKVYTKEEIREMHREIFARKKSNKTFKDLNLKRLSNFNPYSRSHYYIMIEFPKPKQ